MKKTEKDVLLLQYKRDLPFDYQPRIFFGELHLSEKHPESKVQFRCDEWVMANRANDYEFTFYYKGTGVNNLINEIDSDALYDIEERIKNGEASKLLQMPQFEKPTKKKANGELHFLEDVMIEYNANHIKGERGDRMHPEIPPHTDVEEIYYKNHEVSNLLKSMDILEKVRDMIIELEND